jgi:flagellar basal-body rod protein FlgB
MELFDTTQTALERAIEGAAMRQSALAANLANVNTPGYQRRDVDFHDALRAALGGGRAAVEGLSLSVQVGSSVATRADGNGVDVDVEAAELSRNGLEYQALVTIRRSRADILRSAMGVG